MGKLIWHEYARLTTIAATVYAVWASFFGLIYRKFFWDFVGGTLRDPGGLQAPPSAAVFVAVIVKAPLVPTFAMILGLIILALEVPLPVVRRYAIYRSFVLRLVLLIFQVTLNILYYQGTNAAIWSLIAAGCYCRAMLLGETMKEAMKEIQENRGQECAA